MSRKPLCYMINSIERTCLHCGSTFYGRSDKKYCSDQCRSSRNNQLGNDKRDYIRRVNYILRKNWQILTELREQGQNQIGIERLRVKGFDFNYFTSRYPTPE